MILITIHTAETGWLSNKSTFIQALEFFQYAQLHGSTTPYCHNVIKGYEATMEKHARWLASSEPPRTIICHSTDSRSPLCFAAMSYLIKNAVASRWPNTTTKYSATSLRGRQRIRTISGALAGRGCRRSRPRRGSSCRTSAHGGLGRPRKCGIWHLSS